MNKEFLVIVLKRFVKAFVAGGVGALVIALHSTPSLTTLEEWKTWSFVLLLAFVNGGLMAVEKTLQGYRPQ